MAKLVPQDHPALHAIAEEVPTKEIASAKVQKIVKDMRAVLKACPRGVALAAPQIGVPLRIFVVHDTVSERNQDEPRIPDMVCINPRLVKQSARKEEVDEGCLSVPRKYGTVMRSPRATVRAYDETGNAFERGASGLLAQIFQHEIDHLDGILYTDHAREVWDTDEQYEPIPD